MKTKNVLKRLLHNKRAITPVLSELLLTIIAVAAMSIATTATFIITTNMRDNMSERIIVEDVWFNSATQTVDIYMHNVGKVDTAISKVYINHIGQSLSGLFNLDMDDHTWLSIQYDWRTGDTYYIDIVTERGTHIASYYKAV